jgi:Mg2+ and Co2+ transporter CorA
MNKKTLGIILSVVGVAGAIFAYTRVTGFYGQMHSWSPPFESFEISTIIIGVVALVLLIVGIVLWSKKQADQK